MEKDEHLVSLPPRFDLTEVYPFLSKVLKHDNSPISDNMIFNFTNLEFIEPAAVTALSNIIEWLKLNNVNITVFVNANNSAIRYLDDSGFFEYYAHSKIRKFARLRSTTMPLAFINSNESYEWVNNRFSSWLTGLLHISKPSIGNILMSIGEIFINITDHSGVGIGCFFVQHYPRLREVQISISDFGIGIPQKIKNFDQTVENDVEALKKAVEYGYSTQSTPQNRGVGIPTLIENVIIHNQGKMTIISGGARLECLNKDGKIMKDFCGLHDNNLGNKYYPGTLISITLRTDTIEISNDQEEDFSWQF